MVCSRTHGDVEADALVVETALWNTQAALQQAYQANVQCVASTTPPTSCQYGGLSSTPSGQAMPWDKADQDQLTATFIGDRKTFQDQTSAAKKSICAATKGIKSEMTKTWNLAGSSTTRVAYQYFGDQLSGALINWPAIPWCNEGTFDSRYRPWYSFAATGPKNVVLVIDTSGSMKSEGRMNLAKVAGSAVIDTLTSYDWGSVVDFDGDTSIWSSALLPMTRASREDAKSFISGMVADAATNFDDALKAAYTILQSSFSSGRAATCAAGVKATNVIVFLTDGQADLDEAALTRFNTATPARVFSYALGSDADSAKVKRMACLTGGVGVAVTDSSTLKYRMATYFYPLAMAIDSEKIRYIEYQDAVTFQPLLSACLPMYKPNSQPRELLGVSCVDLNIMGTLASYCSDASYAKFRKDKFTESKKCPNIAITEPQIELIRNKIEGSLGSCARRLDTVAETEQDHEQEKVEKRKPEVSRAAPREPYADPTVAQQDPETAVIIESHIHDNARKLTAANLPLKVSGGCSVIDYYTFVECADSSYAAATCFDRVSAANRNNVSCPLLMMFAALSFMAVLWPAAN